MSEKLKIAILINSDPLWESYDIGKDGIAIEKRLVTDVSVAEAKAITEAKSLQPEKITVITYGCQNRDGLLRKALALGADEAIYIGKNDWAKEPDVRITAKALQQVIADYDLLVLADKGNNIYGSELSVACAVALGWQCFNGVISYNVDNKKVSLKRKLEEGKRQEITANLPVVIGFLEDKEYCPYYSLAGKMLASEKIVENFDISYSLLANQLGVSSLPTEYWQKSHLKPQTKIVWQPDANLSGAKRLDAMINGEVEIKHGVKIEGTAEECVDQIIKYLLDSGFIQEI
jgi:electron transfer flavoprotein alpha/beta subunit